MAKWEARIEPAEQVLQHRQGEGGGLTGSGLGDTQQIAAGEKLGDATCLDGCWFDVTLSVESTQQRLGQTEGRKCIQWH